jgi:hypothetical protein
LIAPPTPKTKKPAKSAGFVSGLNGGSDASVFVLVEGTGKSNRPVPAPRRRTIS